MSRKPKTPARIRSQRKSRAGAHADKTVEELAAEQGVQPIGDPRTLRGDFWPQDESVDEFVSWLRDLRRDGEKDG
jgi:hypothetical protein